MRINVLTAKQLVITTIHYYGFDMKKSGLLPLLFKLLENKVVISFFNCFDHYIAGCGTGIALQ
jgi:hypothetical protein